MTTAAPNRLNGHDPTRDILVEAARRMLPVLAGRIVAAATDRAVDGVDQLAERLGDIAEHGLAPRRDRQDPADGEDADDDAARRPTGAAVAILADGFRRLLDLVVRLLAQAAMTLRTATERLRRNRAPQGIDDAGDLDGAAAVA